MDHLAKAWREHLRLALLRTLAETPGYAANESLLTDMAHALGIQATRDQVAGELTWLKDGGLMGMEEIGGLRLATINQRGLDVAAGRVTYPGVKRPSPKG